MQQVQAVTFHRGKGFSLEDRNMNRQELDDPNGGPLLVLSVPDLIWFFTSDTNPILVLLLEGKTAQGGERENWIQKRLGVSDI